jgi:hypothetical protein
VRVALIERLLIEVLRKCIVTRRASHGPKVRARGSMHHQLKHRSKPEETTGLPDFATCPLLCDETRWGMAELVMFEASRFLRHYRPEAVPQVVPDPRVARSPGPLQTNRDRPLGAPLIVMGAFSKIFGRLAKLPRMERRPIRRRCMPECSRGRSAHPHRRLKLQLKNRKRADLI